MKFVVLLTVIASVLALVPACTLADRSWVEEEGEGAEVQGSLPRVRGIALSFTERLGRWMASRRTARLSGSELR